MKTFQSTRGQQSQQRGVTLVVVLMILLVVTVVGIGAAKLALQGEYAARFDRDYQVAWQAAEAALMDAEFDINGPGGTRMTAFGDGVRQGFEVGCASTGTAQGLCLPNPEGTKPVWYLDDFVSDTGPTGRTVQYGTFTGRLFDAGGTGIKPAKAPRYIIEVLDDPRPGNSATMEEGAPPAKLVYRVTAIGFGPRPEVQAVVQMVYRKE